jgi:hypothetical protein
MVIAFVLFICQVSLTLALMYLRRLKPKDHNKIIIQDCLMFEMTRVSLDEYFLKLPPLSKRSSQPRVFGGELNTSRHFKEEILERRDSKQLLKLKQNENDLDEVNKTVGDAGGSVPDSKGTEDGDVQIVNNFVDKRTEQTIDNVQGDELHGSISQVNRRNSKIFTEITMRDYESLTLEEMIVYDKRSFMAYLKHSIIRHNLVFSIILKHSMLDPIYVRIAKLIFSISLIFGTNAMLFDEYYIDRRAAGGYMVIIYP